MIKLFLSPTMRETAGGFPGCSHGNSKWLDIVQLNHNTERKHIC